MKDLLTTFVPRMGILYIVPTPVGNMEDMTMRAIRILKEADLVLAEDTRTSSVLLKHFDIRNRLVAHHKFNEHGTSAGIVDRLKAGETIALISDAGTPGISDPGFYLAREAAKASRCRLCQDLLLASQPSFPRDCLVTGSVSRDSFRRRRAGRLIWSRSGMRCAR